MMIVNGLPGPKDIQPNRTMGGVSSTHILLEFPPHHLIHHAYIGLDDAHDLSGNVFVDVVGDGDAREAVADEGDGDVNALQEAKGVDAAQDEATLIQGLGALGGGADADGREGMADGDEEG